MGQALSRFCDFLIAQQIMEAEDKELYEYCFAILLMNTTYAGICLMVTIYYQYFLPPLIFMISFLTLRSYMGGWHAPSMGSCFLTGLLLFTAIVNVMIYPDITVQGKLLFSGFSICSAGWSVYQFGIQDHPNRKLNVEEKAKAQKRCYKFLAAMSAVMFLFTLLKWYDIVFAMALACFAATTLLLLGKFFQRGCDDI